MKTFKWGVGDPVPVKVFISILLVLAFIPIYVFNSSDSVLGILLFLAFLPIYIICVYKITVKSIRKGRGVEVVENGVYGRIKPLILMLLLFVICLAVFQWVFSELAAGFGH